jgi:transposase-like protein
MSALPFTLAGERKTCPICERPNVRLATSGLEIVREYCCADCGARWSVDGRQDALPLDLDWEVMSLPFAD